jgi:hypothetical protein
VSYPPHLFDELARAFARAAVDRLLEESAAREPRQEGDTAEPLSPVIQLTTEAPATGEKASGSAPVAHGRGTE